MSAMHHAAYRRRFGPHCPKVGGSGRGFCSSFTLGATSFSPGFGTRIAPPLFSPLHTACTEQYHRQQGNSHHQDIHAALPVTVWQEEEHDPCPDCSALAHNVLRMPWSGLLFLAAQVGDWAVHFGRLASQDEGRTGLVLHHLMLSEKVGFWGRI